MRCENTESLGRLIYVTAQEIKNLAEKILKPSGLTLEQFHVLKNMSRTSRLSQRELGEIANKTPANITRILDRLESKSLISRCLDPADRRTSLVSLTKPGEALVDETLEVLESFSARISQGISSSDQKVVRRVLAAMGTNIKKMSDTF